MGQDGKQWSTNTYLEYIAYIEVHMDETYIRLQSLFSLSYS